MEPKKVPQVMTCDESHTVSIPMDKIEKMAELKVKCMQTHNQ
jgi:hypothetical protein